MLYSFIWSKKPDKINRKTIIGDYSQGGLRMLHIQSVIAGLKIAWVKRLLTADKKGSWKCFFDLSMKELGGDLFWTCNLHCNDKIKQVKNAFMREILVSWSNLAFSENPPERYIHNQVIWNNSCIRINGEVIFKRTWINKGVLKMHHLLNEQGTFLTHSEFKNKYEIKCNFLEFFSIISAIPPQWKRVLRNPQTQNKNYQEELIFDTKKASKVCRFIHRKCVDKLLQVPKAQEKWNQILSDPVTNWTQIYIIPVKSTLSTKLRYFQFKILHNIIGVNKLLKRIGIVDSDLCTFCLDAIESVSHLFWECPFTQRFLGEFQKYVLKDEVALTFNNFLFGIPNGYFTTLSAVILYAKYYIFTTRCKDGILSLASFQKTLQYFYEFEKLIYSSQGKFTMFLDNWRHVELI